MSDKKTYDLAIIGGGPAGLTASIYASRYNVNNVVISEFMGGLMSEATEIGNFPSYPKITGQELSQKMQDHAFKSLDGIPKLRRINEVKKGKQNFKLILDNDEEISAKAIIITTGTKHNKLNIPGEKEFYGKGVSYCATCDAFFYKDKTAAVIGGGNAALTSALHLAKVAKKVYVIHRRDKFRGEKYWLDKAQKQDNIEFILNSNVEKITGDQKVNKLILDSKKEVEIDGVFITIGTKPSFNFNTDFDLDFDKKGYIKVDGGMKTNIKGVFAAGDVTNGSNRFKQIVTSMAEGSIAANSAYEYTQQNQEDMNYQ